MPGYISEFDYFGTSDQEFVEIAVPTGTDVSGYSLVFYQGDGTVYNTVSLGSFTGTYDDQDVYLVDQSTPGFDSGGDSMGTFYPDDAIALVDDNGTVIQFISWEGNTVTASEGPASGMSSTNAGTQSDSLQTNDGGNTYFAQSSSNEGSIPACYAEGTMIATPSGARPVERLRPGDRVWTADNGSQTIRWIWDSTVPLEDVENPSYPVLIRASALGPGLPVADLVVSPQHRILVGGGGQLTGPFEKAVFVPAKSLTSLPGIRYLRGRKSVRWLHFSCDHHEVIIANGCMSESLYLGPMILRQLPRRLRYELRAIYAGCEVDGPMNGPLARPTLSVGQVERTLHAWRRSMRSASLEMQA
ncbi:Hint domain-containing protein [Tateyamaria armeniaca]|uniref:Hint domain-containing protein n=1 Tax=Tateyamaria armeniaca TaxID=2518930 RepID=A0ABW8UYU4_9RHOB